MEEMTECDEKERITFMAKRSTTAKPCFVLVLLLIFAVFHIFSIFPFFLFSFASLLLFFVLRVLRCFAWFNVFGILILGSLTFFDFDFDFGFDFGFGTMDLVGIFVIHHLGIFIVL